MTVLLDYQHEVQGYAFGLVSPFGTGIRVESWSGLGRPEQRVGDVDAADSDGQWHGTDYLGPRTFSWTVHCVGSDAAGAMALHDALADAWTFAERRDPLAVAEYRFKIPGRETMLAYGRPRRFDSVLDQVLLGLVDVTMDFFCGDPKLYSDDEIDAVFTLGAGAAGGFVLPITLPLVLAQPALASQMQTLTNRGNSDTFPTITFTGPVTGPRIDNITTGEWMDFPGLVLAAGQTVTIDTRPVARTVARENGGNAFGLMAPGSTFFTLAPGDNVLRFTANAYSSTATAEVTARSAWER